MPTISRAKRSDWNAVFGGFEEIFILVTQKIPETIGRVTPFLLAKGDVVGLKHQILHDDGLIALELGIRRARGRIHIYAATIGEREFVTRELAQRSIASYTTTLQCSSASWTRGESAQLDERAATG